MTMSEYCLTPVKLSVLLSIPHAIPPASCFGSVRWLYTGVRLVPPPTGSNCLRGFVGGFSRSRSGPENRGRHRFRWSVRSNDQKRRFSIWRLTWMVFMTPLARTAILPATVFTPCLNCAMSGPEGSTLSKPDVLPERTTELAGTGKGSCFCLTVNKLHTETDGECFLRFTDVHLLRWKTHKQKTQSCLPSPSAMCELICLWK